MNQLKNFTKGLIKENPILFSMLGLCPALAVTTKLENAIGMGTAFIFVLIMSNIVISLIRKIVPDELRIPIYIVIIASFVTIIEMLLNAFFPNVSSNLGIYLSLIVVNCIILGRAESFASKNIVISSAIDGVGIGIGYTIILSLIAVIREVLGTGKITIWNDYILDINSMFSSQQLPIFSSFFVTSAGAYLVLGLLFAGINKLKRRKKYDDI